MREISFRVEDRAIVAAIISMSKSLGLSTIAEGVETSGQLAFLSEQGCDEAQGYYYCKPLPAANSSPIPGISERAHPETGRSAPVRPDPDAAAPHQLRHRPRHSACRRSAGRSAPAPAWKTRTASARCWPRADRAAAHRRFSTATRSEVAAFPIQRRARGQRDRSWMLRSITPEDAHLHPTGGAGRFGRAAHAAWQQGRGTVESAPACVPSSVHPSLHN